MAAIDYLRQSGLSVLVADGKLRVTPVHLITDTLRQYVRDHREALLVEVSTEPPPEALAWLARVARLLECSPDYLLGRGYIEQRDLAELYRTHPSQVVALIRSNPAWAAPAPKRDNPQIEEDPDEPQHFIQTMLTASPECRAARDAFYNHLMPCRACHAPVGRYCPVGDELRQRYDLAWEQDE